MRSTGRQEHGTRPSPTIPAQAAGCASRHLFGWLACVWLIGFCVFFFSFTLPNNPAWRRVDIWLELPELLQSSIVAPPDASPSGWRYFPQRLDLILVAGSILAGAWGIGHLVLRTLRLPLTARGPEKSVFAFAVGLAGLSLVTLGLGLAGLLLRPLLVGVLAAGFLGENAFRSLDRRKRREEQERCLESERPRRHSSDTETPTGPRSGLSLWKRLTHAGARIAAGEQIPFDTLLLVLATVVVVLFLLAMALGAMLPSTDFDAKEYHLQGPKEFFLTGRVTMLPHNVYTSFPFLTEMLTLLAMVLRGDWYWGALAGKAVLMSFAPLTALALFAAGRRWFTPTAGLLAAFIHLTTPWTYRISIIAGAEGGLTFYLFAALLAVMMGIERQNDDGGRRWCLLAGLLAGSGMACKYPGVVQVVIPMGAVLAITPFLRQTVKKGRGRTAFRSAIAYALGVAIAIGPWLVKNTIETGNPVYPLVYTVFGGHDWDDAVNARWQRAHGPDTYALSDLGKKAIDVTAKSDWLSPLLFGLAPLALLASDRPKTVRWLWIYLSYLFFAWWILTHRLDRFWVPLIPVASLLAGIGVTWHAGRFWRTVCGVWIAAVVLFNLAFVTTPLCGNNGYLTELNQARRAAASTAPGIAFLNEARLGDDANVLCVGEAQVFDARFPLVYNTVFDRSIFQDWCAADQPDVPAGQLPMRPAEEIRRRFEAAGITHVFVNWEEILRYRPSYGYTDFVTPTRFDWLQAHGILGRDIPMPYGYRFWDSLSNQDQAEVEGWAPQLKRRINGELVLVTMQLFPVTPQSRPQATK